MIHFLAKFSNYYFPYKPVCYMRIVQLQTNLIRNFLPLYLLNAPFMIHVIHSFIHSIVCITTGPQPLPKRVLRRVRSSVSSFSSQYPAFPLRSSSSWLRLLPRLTVTSILCCIFPSITCFRREFLRKMWPIQLAFLLLLFAGYSVLFNCF